MESFASYLFTWVGQQMDIVGTNRKNNAQLKWNIHLIGKSVENVEAFLLGFGHRVTLEEQIGLQPRLRLSGLNDAADPVVNKVSVGWKWWTNLYI